MKLPKSLHLSRRAASRPVIEAKFTTPYGYRRPQAIRSKVLPPREVPHGAEALGNLAITEDRSPIRPNNEVGVWELRLSEQPGIAQKGLPRTILNY